MWPTNGNKLQLMDAAEMVSCVCPMTEAKAASALRSYKITRNCRICPIFDRLCGLVVRVSGYRYRGLGFDSRRYQIF